MAHRALTVQCQAKVYGLVTITGLSGSMNHDPACNDNEVTLTGDPLFSDQNAITNLSEVVNNVGVPGYIAPYWSHVPEGTDPSGSLVVDGYNNEGNCRPADFTIEWDDSYCECAPSTTCAATNRTGSGYTLNVTLDVGDCTGPLTDIVWSPAPTSGQGTTTAVYSGCHYNQIYSGEVTSTDDNGCNASAEFSFLLQPGSNPPSCQR